MRTPLLILALSLPVLCADAISYRAGADFALTADPASPAWRDAAGVVFAHDRYGKPVAGHTTEVRSRWTPANLYFLFICPYENLYLKPGPPAAGETNGLWDWDVAEVFIGSDLENIRRYKEFEVSPRGEWIDLAVELAPQGSRHAIDWRWNAGMESKARVDEARKVWYAEMRIPMASLAQWEAAPGRVFRANFYRIQGKPRNFLAWQPVQQDWFHNPEKFGRLLLQDRP